MAPRSMDRALATIRTGDLEGAVPALLSEWNRTRSPRVADLLDRVSGLLGRRPYYLGAWLELALREQTASFTELAASAMYTILEDQDEEQILSDLFDPRATHALLAVLSDPPTLQVRKRIEEAFLLVTDTLATLGDPRAVAPLETLAARYGEVMPTRVGTRVKAGMEAAARTLAARRAPGQLSSADEEACSAITTLLDDDLYTARATEADRTEAGLLRAIAADLANDAPRLAYAAWISERDPARADFIRLQIAAARGDSHPSQRQQEARLRKAGEDRWLGPIGAAVYAEACRWERGFVTAFAITRHETGLIESLIGHPGWSTATEVSFFHVHDAAVPLSTKLLAHRVFDGVRRLNGIAVETLQQLVRNGPRSYESVELGAVKPDCDWPPLLAALDRLPNLSMLRAPGYAPVYMQPLFQSPLAQRLKRLVLGWAACELSTWVAAAESSRFEQVELCDRGLHRADDCCSLRLSFSRDVNGRLTVLDVSRSDDERTGRAEQRHHLQELLGQLKQLPSSALTSFTLHFPLESDAERRTLAAALARFSHLQQGGL